MSDESDKPYLETGLGNSGGWTKEKEAQIPFFKAYIVQEIRKNRPISEIADDIPCHPQTIAVWQQGDVDFRNAVADAKRYLVDQAEKELYERAVPGVPEPVVYQGQISLDTEHFVKTGERRILTIRKKSDQALFMYLKAHRREVYGDYQRTDTTVTHNIYGELKDELRRRFASLRPEDIEDGS